MSKLFKMVDGSSLVPSIEDLEHPLVAVGTEALGAVAKQLGQLRR